jgi:hypothetical protein
MIMRVRYRSEEFLILPQIQGGPQILLQKNLLASLNLLEINRPNAIATFRADLTLLGD